MAYLFTSESVSEGHPDKVSDQISDAILDALLSQDPNSKVACETLVTTGLVVVAGEVRSTAYVDIQEVVREVIKKIGYTKAEYQFEAESCGVLSALHEQSSDIAQGVDVGRDEQNQGAGDQGMMFGYATNETANYMPLAIDISHELLKELAKIRKGGKKMKYLRPDSKSQVTIKYNDQNQPIAIDTIVISTQHDDFDTDKKMLTKIRKDVRDIVIPKVIKNYPAKIKKLFKHRYKLHVNPTGKFVIGGPHGDTGLTGRKIIVDTYGGKGAHGGGAFSGKDSSKVDRSAAYATRHIAKNVVAAGLADQCLVQVAYAIGVPEPVNIFIDTFGTSQVPNMSDGEMAAKLLELFDMRPASIVKRFGLKNPIFTETASYGHMGRTPEVKKVLVRDKAGRMRSKNVELFAWEKLDMVKKLQRAFKVK